jgi:glutamyl-tRNA synthetase
MIVTRFAPSPTGYLHVGNVRTALIAWLHARKSGGKFILRIDDTDTKRSKQEYTDQILRDLEWLGMTWDDIQHQSARLERYEDAKQRLIADERLYPCYESQEELEVKKKILLNRNLPPIYDRGALKLTPEQRQELEAKGTMPHWRFFLKDSEITWHDGVRGDLHFQAKNLSDPVLIRADGSMTYSLASVVDDIDFGVNYIIRGEDHISNSAIHVQMFEALGGQAPNFAHISLLKSKDSGISKRTGGFDIKTLRELGVQPMAICSMLAKMGSSDNIEYRESMEELIAEFSLEKYSKAPVIYDQADLERLNAKMVRAMSFDSIKPTLAAIGADNISPDFWNVARANISNVNDIKEWHHICLDEISPVIKDQNFTNQAAELLPEGEWSVETWNEWIAKVKDVSGRKGKELFMPIRLALTGMEHGPELKDILPLIGRDKVTARLQGRKA